MLDVTVLIRCYNQEQYLFDCIRRLRGHKYEILADYPRLGKCARLNFAIANCDTEWVAFCDADDMSQYLRFSIDSIIGDADLIYSDCYILNKKGVYYYKAGGFNIERLKQNNFIPFSTIIVRTKVAKSIPFEDINGKFEDWIWLYKIAKAGYKFKYIPDDSMIYRDFSHPYGRIPVVRKIKRIVQVNKVRRMIETLSN